MPRPPIWPALQATRPEMKVLLATGNGKDPGGIRGAEWISKPIRKVELLEKVKGMVGKSEERSCQEASVISHVATTRRATEGGVRSGLDKNRRQNRRRYKGAGRGGGAGRWAAATCKPAS